MSEEKGTGFAAAQISGLVTHFDLNSPESVNIPRIFYILKRLKTAMTVPDEAVIEVASDIFLVKSKSRIAMGHTVDIRGLYDNRRYATCDCEDFTVQRDVPEEEKAKRPRPCWHILKGALKKNILEKVL